MQIREILMIPFPLELNNDIKSLLMGGLVTAYLSKRYYVTPGKCITHDALEEYWQQHIMRQMCRERYSSYDSSTFVDSNFIH